MNLLITIGTIIGILGVVPYLMAVHRGTAKPRIVTWAVWSILSAILMISSLLEGQMASAILSMLGFIDCSLVVIMGWKRGSLSIGKADIGFMIGAVVGIAALVIFRDPVLAIYIAIAVDIIAYIPTLIHGWRAPHEENLLSYICSTVAGSMLLAAAIISSHSLAGVVYPVYSVVFNGLMVSLMLASRFYTTQLVLREDRTASNPLLSDI